jgi:hypothetical protein
MTRYTITAPFILAAALFLVSSAGHAQYNYTKQKDRPASRAQMHVQQEQSTQTTQQQVSGQVLRTKHVEVRTLDPKGQAKQNFVALLQTDQGRRVVVDLGPPQQLQAVSLKQGMQVDAHGQWVRIGDRPVLWASRLTVDGKTVQIRRPQRTQPRQLTGQIMRTKEVEIRGTDLTNQVVLLQTDQGRQMVVDLGPMTNLRGLTLKAGAEIKVRGQPARIGD